MKLILWHSCPARPAQSHHSQLMAWHVHRAEVDLTAHTIIQAVGFVGWSLCESLSKDYAAHCALETNLHGPDTRIEPGSAW